MDAGEFDRTLSSELRKLSKEKLSELANALMDRDSEHEKKGYTETPPEPA